MAEGVDISVTIDPVRLNKFMRGRDVRTKVVTLTQIGLRGAQQRAPVRTGNLRRSLYYEVEETVAGWRGRYGTNLKYGLFQEVGTRFHPAHPYLRPSLQDIEEALR